MQKTTLKITKFIKSQAGSKPVVFGLSGGIDSALVAYLAVKALSNKKVHTLIMPTSTNSPDDLRLAKLVAKKLNLQFTIYNLSRQSTESRISSGQSIINEYKKISARDGSALGGKNQKTIGNLKARIRMTLLYAKANEIDGLVLGTGNKSELMTGYFTKYGDGGVDILPIGDLYKTEIKKLAKYLGVPQEIIDRPPTAGLWAGQTDEAEMGITYEKLDQILEAIQKKKSLSKFNKKEVEKIKKMIKNSEHKRKTPPICVLSK